MADGKTPADPSALMNDPVLAGLLSANPSLLSSLSGGGAPTQQMSLAEMLVASAMDVTGRYGQTGRGYTAATLPPWAQTVAPEVLSNPDFDPYLGVVSQQGDERVFMGARQYDMKTPTNHSPTNDEFVSGGRITDVEKTPGDDTLTLQQASNLPYTWDEEEVSEAMEKMKAAGMTVDSFDSLVDNWGALVYRAAMTYSLSEGKRKVSPWDVLDLYKDESKRLGTGPFTGDKTMVSRNVTEITEGEAWSNIQSTLSQMLGRDPSDQETRDFTYRMNKLAARNPSISKTVTSYKAGEATGSSTHTDPGFTNADMAKEAYDTAQADPDYAEYQSATTYFNATLSALGPIGG